MQLYKGIPENFPGAKNGVQLTFCKLAEKYLPNYIVQEMICIPDGKEYDINIYLLPSANLQQLRCTLQLVNGLGKNVSIEYKTPDYYIHRMMEKYINGVKDLENSFSWLIEVWNEKKAKWNF